mmetsp:Transcript_125591/g.313842  ORF Transcript_125591/g.313842 Transcript_125591/m.313842 type:complete len:241 (-) Transcript_125591:201-923(-)
MGRGGAVGTWCTNTGPAAPLRSSTKSLEADSCTTSAFGSCSLLTFIRRARHCASDQSSMSAPAAGAGPPLSFAAPSPPPPPTGSAHLSPFCGGPPPEASSGGLAQAWPRKSASSPTVTGMPMGIFSRSCMGIDERCIPQPSSGDVHCLLTGGFLSSAPSSPLPGGFASACGRPCCGAQMSNSQTSARTLLGSDGATTPQLSGGEAPAEAAAGGSSDEPTPSRRMCAPPLLAFGASSLTPW